MQSTLAATLSSLLHAAQRPELLQAHRQIELLRLSQTADRANATLTQSAVHQLSDCHTNLPCLPEIRG